MKEAWNQEKYQELIKELYSYQDLDYQKFQSQLGICNSYLIGVRTPILKKIAKQISQTDYTSFLHLNHHNTYEERLLHGLLIGYLKEDFHTIQKLFWDYISYIDNWALCDLSVSNLHIWRNYQEEGFSFVKSCLKQKSAWYQRVGFILLLDYYIEEKYINQILEICNHHKTEEYYVKMAIAWLLSMCYIKQKDKTLEFLKKNALDSWIQNKAIQKIRESNRVSKIEKDGLLIWKKKQ